MLVRLKISVALLVLLTSFFANAQKTDYYNDIYYCLEAANEEIIIAATVLNDEFIPSLHLSDSAASLYRITNDAIRTLGNLDHAVAQFMTQMPYMQPMKKYPDGYIPMARISFETTQGQKYALLCNVSTVSFERHVGEMTLKYCELHEADEAFFPLEGGHRYPVRSEDLKDYEFRCR